MQKNPNAELARKITERLIAERLLHDTNEKEAEQKLVSGTAKAEDWRLWTEKTLPIVQAGDES